MKTKTKKKNETYKNQLIERLLAKADLDSKCCGHAKPIQGLGFESEPSK